MKFWTHLFVDPDHQSWRGLILPSRVIDDFGDGKMDRGARLVRRYIDPGICLLVARLSRLRSGIMAVQGGRRC